MNNGIYFANGYIDAIIDLSAEMKNIEIDLDTRIAIQSAMITCLSNYKLKVGINTSPTPVVALKDFKDFKNDYDNLGSTLKDIQP